MLDKFVAGLKPQVKLEVLKSGPANLEVAARIAMNVDSALYGAGMFQTRSGPTFGFGNQGPQPMEIGNVENTHYRGKSFRGKRAIRKNENQMTTDRRNGACFICHKVGCRARYHEKDSEQKMVTPNNAQVMNNGLDSEN